jgi:hypothetical protein
MHQRHHFTAEMDRENFVVTSRSLPLPRDTCVVSQAVLPLRTREQNEWLKEMDKIWV